MAKRLSTESVLRACTSRGKTSLVIRDETDPSASLEAVRAHLRSLLSDGLVSISTAGRYATWAITAAGEARVRALDSLEAAHG